MLYIIGLCSIASYSTYFSLMTSIKRNQCTVSDIVNCNRSKQRSPSQRPAGPRRQLVGRGRAALGVPAAHQAPRPLQASAPRRHPAAARARPAAARARPETQPVNVQRTY